MADILATLTAPSWRGIPFPLSGLEESFDQDHAIHAFVYRDGVHIEAVGRNAFGFHLSIPFFNGVQPAPTELWAGQTLYPDLFRKFRAACVDRTTGPFVHPELGTIQCKPRNYHATYATEPRDGARISVTLMESVDGDELNGNISQLSALTTAQQSATRLDTLLSQNRQPMPELAQDTSSFGDMMAAFVSGTAGLGRIRSKVDSLSVALGRLNDVSNWELATTNEDMRAALIDLDRQPSLANKPVRTFIPARDMPLMTISISLGVKATDLVTMNPGLARDPLVRAGTRIQYEVAA